MASRPQMDIRHSDMNTNMAYMEPRYVVVHYTAGGGNVEQDGTRLSLCSYFSNGYRGASANYFIDNGGIAEYADPDERFTWHCGDGNGAYGITNANSIGIEVCAPDYSDHPYTDAEIAHLRSLVTWLMERYGIDRDHVVRHYDASRKSCPWYYTNAGNGGDAAWYALRETITSGAKAADKEADMVCIIKPNSENRLVWFDGTNLHDLDNVDELEAVKTVYRACNGREIPYIELGVKEAHWYTRFRDAVCHRADNYESFHN